MEGHPPVDHSRKQCQQLHPGVHSDALILNVLQIFKQVHHTLRLGEHRHHKKVRRAERLDGGDPWRCVDHDKLQPTVGGGTRSPPRRVTPGRRRSGLNFKSRDRFLDSSRSKIPTMGLVPFPSASAARVAR